MMDDIIYRHEAINAFMNATSDGDKFDWCKFVLMQVPSAQRTGRWIWDDEAWGDEAYKCSACGYYAYNNSGEVILGDFKFCPNCGARMEVEQE